MTRMKRASFPNLEILEGLLDTSRDAYRQENFLQSGIIPFQVIEALLRKAIEICGKHRGVSDEVLVKAVDEEQSFFALCFVLI